MKTWKSMAIAGGLAISASLPCGPTFAEPVSGKAELAARYIEAQHLERTLDEMLEAMEPVIMAEAPKTQAAEDFRPILMGILREVSANAVPRMKTEMVAAVEQVFTEAELAGLVAFYEGPLGQVLISKSPQMAKIMAPSLAKIQQDMMIEALTKVLERLCDTGACAREPRASSPRPS